MFPEAYRKFSVSITNNKLGHPTMFDPHVEK
jgi:hypothetical protein